MSCIKMYQYNVEEHEAAMALCQLRWCGKFFNQSKNEFTIPLSPAPPSPDSSLNAAVTSTPTDSLPGPSSAPDMEVSDCNSNVRSKYKLSLFERYKQEQREWALATQNIRVTAGDSMRTAGADMLTRDDRQPSRGRVEKRSVGVVAPQCRTKVRRTAKNNIITTLLKEEVNENSDSDTSEGAVTDGESPRKTKIGNITVSSRLLQQLGSMKANKATRKLLTEVFPRRVLATHSLTGRPSPAFPNKPVKKRLDPAAVETIIDLVVQRCNDANERDVRMSITTKLADECKMQRHRLRRDTEL